MAKLEARFQPTDRPSRSSIHLGRLRRSREQLQTVRTHHWSFVDIAAGLPAFSENAS